jgi:type I restriction enzyme S subunit
MIEYVKIKDFATVITGGTPSTTKNDYWDSGTIPWLNSGELNQDIITSTRNYITQQGLDNCSARLMSPDTVLIALTGTTTGVVGYLTFEACANQSVTGILPSNKHIPKYLYYFLKSIRKKIVSEAYGGAQPHISQGYVKDLEIPLPPLPKQQKIANILDAADALRQNDKALIAKYDELTQALFLDMFGDPYLNINNWLEKTCGEFIYYLADIGSNGANSVVSEKLVMTDTEDYALMIRTTNLTRNDFSNNIKYVSKEVYDFFKKSQIFGGEIIMNKIGSAGDFWLMPHLNRPVSLGLNQFVIRLKDINTLYFYYFLSTDYGTKNIKSRINGVATKSITKTAVRELPILFPPIELQNQFAERVAVIEEQKAIAQKSLEKSESLFNSLLQKAFKGELN